MPWTASPPALPKAGTGLPPRGRTTGKGCSADGTGAFARRLRRNGLAFTASRLRPQRRAFAAQSHGVYSRKRSPEKPHLLPKNRERAPAEARGHDRERAAGRPIDVPRGGKGVHIDQPAEDALGAVAVGRGRLHHQTVAEQPLQLPLRGLVVGGQKDARVGVGRHLAPPRLDKQLQRTLPNALRIVGAADVEAHGVGRKPGRQRGHGFGHGPCRPEEAGIDRVGKRAELLIAAHVTAAARGPVRGVKRNVRK